MSRKQKIIGVSIIFIIILGLLGVYMWIKMHEVTQRTYRDLTPKERTDILNSFSQKEVPQVSAVEKTKILNVISKKENISIDNQSKLDALEKLQTKKY